jgi:hypothetical protein
MNIGDDNSFSFGNGECAVKIENIDDLIRKSITELNQKGLFLNRVFMGNFNGANLYVDTDLPFGAAYTLPGVGIHIDVRTHQDYIGTDQQKKQEAIQLLKHEFGHILQATKYGKPHFYLLIAPVSLISAATTGQHQCTWTEIEANLLALDYYCKSFNDCFWNSSDYPVSEFDCSN